MAVMLATAAILYFAPLAVLVGRRHLVELVHVYTGFALPVPLIAGWVSSKAFRRDTSELNRFSPRDWEWLRARDRRSGRIPVGKFNAGQKLNGAFTVGSILVMLGSGIIMYFTHLLPIQFRTGATFVHDWAAFAIGLVIAGHLWFAAKDPQARAGMRNGLVREDWARREHGAWVKALLATTRSSARSSPGPGAATSATRATRATGRTGEGA
jgi:formate dehydrogenase subunit gamma